MSGLSIEGTPSTEKLIASLDEEQRRAIELALVAMNADLIRDYASLPAQAQKEVIDFVAFLKCRYLSMEVPETSVKTALADEPFIGMWLDREDLSDSTGWVRNLRENEWRI